MSVRGSNPHLSFNRPLPTRQTDSIIMDVTNALTVIRLTRRVWAFNCQRYERTTADDSDRVTDNDSVTSGDGESDE